MTDLSRLRELAEKATPGPWCVVQPLLERANLSGAPDGFDDLSWCPEGDRSLRDVDAAYIAAVSPDVLLDLLDQLERAAKQHQGIP